MFNDFLLSLYVKMSSLSLRREEGQGALEYLAIIVGLIALVVAAFEIFGGSLVRRRTPS